MFTFVVFFVLSVILLECVRLVIARALSRLGVTVCEAGFPIASLVILKTSTTIIIMLLLFMITIINIMIIIIVTIAIFIMIINTRKSDKGYLKCDIVVYNLLAGGF